MSKAYTPGLEISAYKTILKTRELPLKGKVLVKKGEQVQSSTIVLSAELPGELDIIRIADRLGYDVERVLEGMKVKVGDEVKVGDLLCEVSGLFSWFKEELKSSSAGKVEFFTESNAHLGIRQKSEQLSVNAYIGGEVLELEEEKTVSIQTTGTFIQGIFGVGSEKSGEVFVLEKAVTDLIEKTDLEKYQGKLKNKILIGGMGFSKAALKFCAEQEISAVITGSIEADTLHEFLGYEIGVSITGDEVLPFTLIITEGFGSLAISQRITELAKKFNGKFASVSGATQIRAGAMRPELIIPHNDSSLRDQTKDEIGLLNVGSKVRVIRVPYFGMFAEVLDLPHEPQVIATGAEVRVAKIRLENKEEVLIPRANLEMV